MLRRKTVWITVVLIIIIASAGGYYYYASVYTPSQVVEEAPLQTAVVRQGSIVISATGAGTVIADNEISLGFQSSGILAEVLMEVGDTVQAGDVLARLDDTNAQQNLALAELQLEQAAIEVNPDTIAANVASAEVAVSQAEINLAEAQASLDDLLHWETDNLELQLADW